MNIKSERVLVMMFSVSPSFSVSLGIQLMNPGA